MASTKVAQRGMGTATAEAGEAPAPHRRTATLTLPFVTAEFRAPEIHLPSLPVRAPDRSDLTGVVSAVRAHLPAPGQAAYYAGLGALGALQIIEWPVALAIGVGTVVAQHYGGTGRAASEQRGGDGEDGEDTAAP